MNNLKNNNFIQTTLGELVSKEKNYSLSAGQYFDVKIEYTDITPAKFDAKMNEFKTNLDSLFAESKTLETEIQKQLNGLKYE